MKQGKRKPRKVFFVLLCLWWTGVCPLSRALAQEGDGWLRLKEVRLTDENGEKTVFFRFSRPPEGAEHFPLHSPTRLVIDVKGPLEVSSGVKTYPAADPLISRVRVGYHPGKMRLVLDLKAEKISSFSVDRAGVLIKVLLGEQGSGKEGSQVLFLSEEGETALLPPARQETAKPVLSPVEGDEPPAIETPGPVASQGEQDESSGEALAPPPLPEETLVPSTVGAADEELQPMPEAPHDAGQPASLSAVESPQATSPETQPPSGAVESEPYRMRKGDLVSIRFINNPELRVDVPVRPDGKISLALVGEVAAEGLTLAELRLTLSEQYKSFVEQTHYGEVLKEGDDLQIRFMYNPELDQALHVRPDGKISLPLIGEIQAAGVRPADLRQRLVEEYAEHLRDPDVTLVVGGNVTKKIFADENFISVALLTVADQEIFVGGEVLTPKVVRFNGQITTLQAIMQAGGVKETGDLSQVVVLRRGQFEEGKWIQTNLSNPVSGKSLQNDVVLNDGDVVVVPMTGIAKVDLFVKQYIREVLPLESEFGVTVMPVGKRDEERDED